ncbi:unknown [Firmicutes bacterium CAG:170]|nr:unknown [Firmicutes bacterium CAG:170]
MLFRNVEDHFHLRMRQDGAGRIAGIRDHDGAGALVDGGLELLTARVEVALLRTSGNGPDGSAGRCDERIIVGIKRLGNDDLVAVVENAVCSDLERLAAAGRDQNVLRADLHADLAVIVHNGVDQHRDTGRGRVGKRFFMEASHGFKQSRRRRHIWLTDIQMVDFFAGRSGCDGIRMKFTHG